MIVPRPRFMYELTGTWHNIARVEPAEILNPFLWNLNLIRWKT
jgi:hypothetical protein